MYSKEQGQTGKEGPLITQTHCGWFFVPARIGLCAIVAKDIDAPESVSAMIDPKILSILWPWNIMSIFCNAKILKPLFHM